MHVFIRWARGVLPVAVILFFAPFLWAQPQLTTIDDVIYRADGSRFDGTALVEWRSFLLADYTTVAAYSKSVRVVNGSLRVSLAPTTTSSSGSHYQVRYVSNGRLLYMEYWGVPPSTSTLKLKDVRLAGPPMPSQDQTGGQANDVTIPDVTGLADELSARAKKGIGFQPSHAAVINSAGELVAAIGEPADCVRVDGTSGPCSSGSAPAGPSFVDNETPAGLINGSNATFTLANPPDPATSLLLYRNGLLQRVSLDYTLAGNIITFLTAATPQTGDVIAASYRLTGVSGESGNGEPAGQAGGALTGYYPAPSIASGAISDSHIATSAAIQESKLALNFATHSNASDPSPEQKSALTGTAGTPSSGNRYVTNQDPRLADARTPVAHNLLSASHGDTTAGTVSRGDLIVGLGTTPTSWTRLPLGGANRCLISNGFDAVWNACLYTGFPTGAVPFVDSSGNLSHNQSRLSWDNATRRLAIGAGSPTATLSVHDASAGDGVTSVAVRAGENQQTTPLQRWQNNSAADIARVESDGTLLASAVQATSTAARAAWQETGTATDPPAPTAGSAWFNTSEESRKTREGAQTHTLPQVICSIAGTSTTSTSLTTLGSCTVPAGMLRSGDRIEIRADLSHEGSSTAFSVALSWGSVYLTARSGVGSESSMAVKAEVFPSSQLYWNWQSWGTSTTMFSGGGSNTSPPSGNILIEVKGQMSTSTAETLTLRNLAVVRLPAQSNP
ncbi:MAG: hypothetical protein JST93_20370 [Acidobacteria bacterium]|nr:hypothetical protein [Acidobacteriota bacterium]